MRIFSARHNAAAINTGLLLLRIVSGGLMIHHGYQKLTGFSGMKSKFMDFAGLGPTVSLSLTLFAEFFCAIMIMLGVITRFSALVLMIAMTVALFLAHGGDVYGKGEMAALYLGIFSVLLITGPGHYSIDHHLFKK